MFWSYFRNIRKESGQEVCYLNEIYNFYDYDFCYSGFVAHGTSQNMIVVSIIILNSLKLLPQQDITIWNNFIAIRMTLNLPERIC